MTDDVKELSERLRAALPFQNGKNLTLMKAAADMLDRLASQREDVIEECAKVVEKACGSQRDLATAIRSLATQPRAEKQHVPDFSMTCVHRPDYDCRTSGTCICLKDWKISRPQPRSNSVEDGAGRDSIQIESSSDTASANAEFYFYGHLLRQRLWSTETFGPGDRAKGVVDHIRKELCEIEADPTDLTEWIDVVILALDGAWRSGASPQEIIAALLAKQSKNEKRIWPDWRTADPNKAIEHDRSPQKAVIDTEQSGHVLSQELKPHNGRIRNWYKLECDNGLGYYIMGTLLDHPTIPVKHTNTSWIEKHDLATGEIETRNSRYTLLGEELKS